MRGGFVAAAMTALLLVASTVLSASDAWNRKTVETMNGPVTVNVTGTGRYRIALTDPVALPSIAAAEKASGASAEPMSLAKGDFDGDGMQDLAVGYAAGTGGTLSLYKGNADALYPYSRAAKAHRANGTFSDLPFLSTGISVDLPCRPDFLAAGDFNLDGHEDLLVAEKGGQRLVLLAGDGQGGFSAPQVISLPGTVTDMAAGFFGRAGQIDAVVGVHTSGGSQLLVYGNVNDRPQTLGLPADASDIAFGVARPRGMLDMAVAAGSSLVLVSEEGGALASSQRAMPFTISSVAVGSFTGSGLYQVALLSSTGDVSILSNGSTAQVLQPLAGWASRTITQAPIEGATRLVVSKVSGAPGQDLLVEDPAGKSVHMLIGGDGAQGSSMALAYQTGLAEDAAVSTTSAPVAVLPMRLSVSAIKGLVIAQAGMGAPVVQLATPTATFTVTSNADSGAGTLRSCINLSNAAPGLNLIQFNLPSGGTTITPLTPLPAFTVPVILDGSTEPGFSGTPLVTITGVSQGSGDILAVNAGGSTIRALDIENAPGNGVTLGAVGGDVVEGCIIGNNRVGIQGNSVSDNTIGGSTMASFNNLEINPKGVSLDGGTSNTIEGNIIRGNPLAGIYLTGGASNIIGGTGAFTYNQLTGNGVGIFLTEGSGNSVLGNFIGERNNGGTTGGNTYQGIVLLQEINATIGGASPAARNVIGNNGSNGIDIQVQATGAIISGNYIGVSTDGTTAAGNSGDGVTIAEKTTLSNLVVGGTAPGAGNVIANNTGYGVNVTSGTGNGILGNAIFSNGKGAISLASGANNNQSAPVLTGAYACGGTLQVLGTLASTPNTAFTIEFFSNAVCPGQARTFLGRTTATTDATGKAAISASLAIAPPLNVDATATDPNYNTSMLSNCIVVGAGPDLGVTFSAPAPAAPKTGQTVTYVVNVQNASGTTAATNAALSVTLPSGAASYALGGTTGSPTVSATNPVVVTWPTIPASTSYLFQYSVNYPSAGSFTTSASVAADQCDPNTANNSVSNSISVLAPLAVTWSASTTTATVGVPVNFTAAATGGDGNYTYTFYPADGSGAVTSTTATFTHSFATPGTYGTYVQVKDGTGSTANSSVVNVVAASAVTVSITAPAAPVTSAVPFTVNFTALASGGSGSYTYAWTFGDGGTGTGASASHPYTTAGAYTAKVVATDGAGRTGSATLSVTAQASLTVSLSAAPTHGFVPLAVNFTPVISGGSGSYPTVSYTYGDASAASSTPSHSYAAAGTFTASVSVTDSAGNTATSGPVTINAWNPLSIGVTTVPAAPITGNAPLTVGFTTIVTGGAGTYNYAWTFGDGTTGNVQNPSHTYFAAGTYMANLTVTDGAGNSDTTAVGPITVSAPLQASLAATPLKATLGSTITFLPSITGGVAPYTLFFHYGDTNTGSSPTYLYGAAGTYQPTLTVTDSAGSTYTTQAVTVTIWAPLTVSASATSATTGNAALTVGFTAQAAGGDQAYSYTWYFGDGASFVDNISPSVPSHTYAAAGTYYAYAVAADGSGHTATSAAIKVTSLGAMAAGLSATPIQGFASLGVSFLASVSGGDGNYTYTFNPGDGTGLTTSPSPGYTHTYATAGTYNALLTASDGSGNSASAGITIQVWAPLQVILTNTSATSGIAPLTAGFSAAISGGNASQYNLSWNFSDGAPDLSSGSSSPMTDGHTWNTAGTYNVSVTVTDASGNTATSNAIQVTAQNTLGVGLSAIPTRGFKGMQVAFTAVAQGGAGPYTYALTPGDGSGTITNSTGLFTFTYLTAGSWNASVTVTDSASHSATSSTVPITVWNPLTVSASATPLTGATPLTVTFNGSAAGGDGNYTYTWTFGDGSQAVNSTTPSAPAHTYSLPGTYTAAVTVSDGSGHSAGSAPIQITVQGVMSASLSATPTLGFAPLGVTFAPSVTGGDGNYTYSFAYGDSQTGSAFNHTYAAGGKYTVTMTVSDGSGHSAVANVYVTVWDPLSVALSASSGTSGLTPLSVIFSATAAGGDLSSPYTWTWSWGDGTTSTTTGASPATASHTYNTPGTYNVTVTVADASGHRLTSNTIPVTAQTTLGVGLAAFPTRGFQGMQVAFTAVAQGGVGPYTYVLTPGDGSGTISNSTGLFTFTYSTAGSYNAFVAVTDSASHQATSSNVPITVWAPLSVSAAANVTTGPVPLAVNFTGRASGGDTSSPYAWTWSWGDGTTTSSMGASPSAVSHSFNTPGTYNVTVTVADASGHEVTSNTIPVTAQGTLSVGLGAFPTRGFAGMQVSFTATAQGGVGPYTYVLTPGNGSGTITNSTGLFTVTYASAGNFSASVAVTDSAGNKATSSSVPITVWSPLSVKATANVTTGPVPLTVNFTGSATGGDGSSYSYSWSFGNGNTATGAAPSFIYNLPGTYSVTCTVTDGSGNTQTSAPLTIVAQGVMNATLTATPILGFAPLGVSFTPAATGGDGNYTYSFDYGDGNTGSSLVHTYGAGGTYHVVMTASDGSGNKAMANVDITVWNSLSVTLGATSATSGLSPLKVNFSATASGGDQSSPYTWTWSWGDGTTSTSTGASPATASHVFNTPGTYNVTVTVTDASGHKLTSNSIPVAAQSTLGVGLTAFPIHGFANLDVSFKASAQGGSGGYSFSLNPGDGSGTITNATGNFTYTYSTVGTFQATVTVKDSAGNTQTSTPAIVTVWGPLTVTASASPATTGAVPLAVGFSAAASGGDASAYSYKWDFGNGNTATGATPTFTYNIPGTYTVTVTVTDGSGNTATSTPLQIVAQGVISAALSASPMVGTDPLTVSFTATAQGGVGPYTYTYHYDGTNTDGLGHFTYLTPGTFNAYVHVVDSVGNVADSPTVPITVWAPLSVSASALQNAGILPFDDSFTATVSGGDGVYTYLWNFGDGSNSTGATPSHIYNLPGTYSVTVTVTDGHNHTMTSTPVVVTAYKDMMVSITGGPTSGTVPLTVNLSAAALGGDGNYTFLWNFGDQTTAMGETANHTFAAIGDYTVSVTATDGSSKSATATIIIHVLPVPPQIAAAKKLPNPFRIVLYGTNFHADAEVTINGRPVAVSVKTGSKIILKGVQSLVPKGVPVQIVVINQDDGGVSNTFLYVRTPA